MGQLIRLYDENPNPKTIREVVAALESGAIVIYPTDTLYAMGCSVENIKTISKIKAIKGKDNDNLSLICNDLQCAAKYARIDNATFKILREHAPAPVTFVLKPTGNVPNKFLSSKKSVGIRIPDSNIARAIVEELGHPLVSTSLPLSSLEEENQHNSELLWEEYGDKVDIFIDGGDSNTTPSTVVEIENGSITILREGAYQI